MKANDVPENVYVNFPFGERHPERGPMVTKQGLNAEDIEYTRTDAFIEKALKWYCLDCECNDNCKANHNCFFRDMFKLFLEGDDHALPPKVTSSIKPDGTTKENYLYRHFIRKMQDAFIEKACKFLSNKANIPLWEGYAHTFGCDTTKLVENFKNYMKGK